MKPIAEITFWIACFLYLAAPIETARILAIMPLPSYSHQITFRPLWAALSQKGHEVVLITTNPINDPSLTNLTEIDLRSSYKFINQLDFVKNKIEKNLNWLDTLRTQMWPLCREGAENIFQHPEIRKMYVSNSDQKFDVVMAEVIKIPGLFAFAHRFKAPLIGLSSLGLYNANHYLIGAPVLPSHLSSWEMEDDVDFNLSLWQRIKNFIHLWYHIYSTLNHFYPEQQAIAEKYLGKNIPDISDIERNISLVFLDQQDAISFVRPKTPNTIIFGNLHISRKLVALPKNLTEFIADAPNGFIYMSLGTIAEMSSFPEHTQNIFRDVFAGLPYKVIWKYNGKLSNKPDNVYIDKWFSQHSILAHPNIKLFIYQGGRQSSQEAIYYSVPLLGLPILADQCYQVNKLVSLGIAKSLDVRHLSSENLNASIMEILSDKRYKKRMIKLKILNEDQPYNLLEHLIWWTEFVIRHKGAPHLRTTIADDPWYKRYEMDVIAILTITIFVTLFCTLIIIYKLLKMIFNRMKMSVIKNKQSKKKIN